MVDVKTYRKNKIELSEYDYLKDIQNRVLMSQFSPLDLEVLEEILYSSLKTPISILGKNLDLSHEKLLPILEKLSQTKLFSIEKDHVVTNKEMRKYYEFQILKFEEDFHPGMEYFQGLLRKVPIHILPLWYAISRTASNIFESIVEKYLLTPQIFRRYLLELELTDPIQQGIMNAVYQSPNYEVDAKDIRKKFDLSLEAFEEHMLHLEFRIVCCVQFRKEGNEFKEVITPFHEWGEYLRHIRNSELTGIIDEETIERKKESNFAIIEELSSILEKAPLEESFSEPCQKLCALHLAEMVNQKFILTEDGRAWLKMSVEDQSIYLYRHPGNHLKHALATSDRIIKDAEKSLISAVNVGWIFMDDFLKGIYLPLNENQMIMLERCGRSWKYKLPKYNENELDFFKAIIQRRLFEIGITAIGTQDGRECFRLTPFGNSFFSNE